MDNKNVKESQGYALSSCMESELAVTKVIEKLDDDDFTVPELRNIFQAVKSLFRKNQNIDLTTVMDEMDNLKFSYDRGWMMTDFDDCSWNDSHVDEHIEIILKYSLIRKITRINNTINQMIKRSDDVNDIIEYSRKEFIDIESKETKYDFTIQEAVLDAMRETEDIYVNHAEVGLSSNIYSLDQKVIFKKGNVIVIAAKKSVGKSVLVNQIVFHNASIGKKGVIFNMEMPQKTIINRDISRIGEIDYSDISMGTMPESQFEKYQEAAEKISKYPVIICTQKKLTTSRIHSKLIMFKNKLKGLDWVVIDYIQLIKTDVGHSRQRELADVSQDIQVMAQHFDCPFFVLSQVNNDGITREAEDLENDADIVIKLRRPIFEWKSKYAKAKEKPDCEEDYATLQITKNKNGKTGGIELRSILHYQCFDMWNKVY